jgi:hypothetical protein
LPFLSFSLFVLPAHTEFTFGCGTGRNGMPES